MATLMCLLPLAAAPAADRGRPPTVTADAPRSALASAGEPARAKVVRHVDTRDPVAFLTIDDGIHRTPAAAEVLDGIPATFFLNSGPVTAGKDYWSALGHPIQAHTIRHPTLTRLDAQGQREEVCGNAARISKFTGKPVWMLRPPYGVFNATTQHVAAGCGIDYIVMWDAIAENGRMQYGRGGGMTPGTIILLHFTPRLADDLRMALAAMRKAGLQPGDLTEYLPARSTR